MNSSSKDFGRFAEALAENWLRQKGYRILERNLQIGHGELDLVVQHHDTLVFVEVKGRRTEQFGGAPYAVTPHKQRQLIKLALAYLTQHELSDIPCRFDVILGGRLWQGLVERYDSFHLSSIACLQAQSLRAKASTCGLPFRSVLLIYHCRSDLETSKAFST